MTKTRGGSQKRGLNFVAFQTLDYLGQHFISQPGGIGNESTETPEDGRQLANHTIRPELGETGQWYLNIRILLHETQFITTSRKTQVAQINFAGNLAKSKIAVGRAGVKRVCAIDVSSRRGDQRQVQHRQGAAERCKW